MALGSPVKPIGRFSFWIKWLGYCQALGAVFADARPMMLTRNVLSIGRSEIFDVLFQTGPRIEPPSQLWIQGSDEAIQILRKLPTHAIAIVGTRIPERSALKHLREVIFQLAKSCHPIIISGLARGIDAYAHQYALECNLPCIAVLAGAIDNPYPRETFEIRNRILSQHGLVISETPSGTPPRPSTFLKRNRLIATWSNATWVVQAHSQSGAINTANWARKAEKDLYATPCFPNETHFSGNQILLSDVHYPALSVYDSAIFEKSGFQISAFQPGAAKKNDLSFGSTLSDEIPLEEVRKKILKKIANWNCENAVPSLAQRQAEPCTFENLITWSIESGINTNVFFSAYQKLADDRQIIESEGLLLKNPSSSD